MLTSIAFAGQPALHVLGLLFLLVSFWAIYERGYVDNDLIAARFEKAPKLSAAFQDSPVATPYWQPWIWALVCGGIAIFLLRWPAPVDPLDGVKWIALLLATHVWFVLYNRFDKATRVWLFCGLQFARSAAFIVLVPIALIGVAAIGAHVLAKWVPYYVYRLGGKDWPDTPFHITRLLFFIVLGLLIAFEQGFSILLTWTAAALLAWNLYRARQELKTAYKTASRLDRASMPVAALANLISVCAC